MKVSLITWRLFWDAFDKQDLAGLDKWLGRWVFAADGVRLSMRTQPLKTGNSDLVVEYGETAEKSLSLAKAHALVDAPPFLVKPRIMAEFGWSSFQLRKNPT